MDNLILKNNKESDKKRFEFEVEGKTAFMEYILTNDGIYLVHTEVPHSLEGHGLGTKLVELVLEYVEKKGLKLIPLCPFVAAYLKKHPEKHFLIKEGYRV